MIPLVYHPRYNITALGLERMHPFDGRKYRHIHDALIARGVAPASGLLSPDINGPARPAECAHARVSELVAKLQGACPHPGGADRQPIARLF